MERDQLLVPDRAAGQRRGHVADDSGLAGRGSAESRGTLNLQGRVMWRMNEYQTVLFITLVAVLVALALVN